MENTPVIVVTQEKERRKGVLWIAGATAAGVALLGGSTFALWSASDAFSGGTITAGDLNVVADSTSTFWDVSADNPVTTAVPGTGLTGSAIADLADFRIVPGDTVAKVATATVTLVGDNIVGALRITSASGVADNFTAGDGLDWNFEIRQGTDVIASGELPNFAGGDPLVLLTRDAANIPASITEGYHVMSAATEDISVVITAEFTDANINRENVDATAVLDDMALSLQQVRGPSL